MKKSYIVGGALILAAALGLVIFINTKGPSNSAASDATVASNDPNGGATGHGHVGPDGNTHGGQGGIGGIGMPTDPKNQQLENVVVNSRIAEEFRFLDDQMEVQYERLKNSAGPEELAIFERLRAQLKGDDLLNQFREVLKGKFSEGELAQLSAIYQAPAYAKYKEMEAANRSPEGMKAVADFSRTFKMESLPSEKQAALREYVESSGAVDNMMGMLKNVETIFGGGMSKPNNKDVKAYEDLLRKSLENTMLAAAAYNFQNTDVSGIKDVSQLVGHPLHRAADTAKTEFVGDTLVKVVKPEIEKQVQDPK